MSSTEDAQAVSQHLVTTHSYPEKKVIGRAYADLALIHEILHAQYGEGEPHDVRTDQQVPPV